jgi:predicted dehydrogenase
MTLQASRASSRKWHNPEITRRSSILSLALGSASVMTARLHAARQWTVCILGHTGRGNYGHGLEIAFQGTPGVVIAAVADPVADGREKAAARSGALRQYADYREMLQKEDPDIAVIGLRHLDQRVAMAEAIGKLRAHVLMEKAVAATLEDGDAMIRALGNRKVQVCHTARPTRRTQEAIRLIHDGAIGEVLELRARGKEDHRAGGEDMLTLGTHCFDLMRMVMGNPIRCSGHVEGPRKQPTEPIGPVAGDRVLAMFEFAGGVRGYFASEKNGGPDSFRYGVTVYGTKGAIAFPLNDIPNKTWILRDSSWRGTWVEIEPPGGEIASSHREVNNLMAKDLLAAIEEDRAPMCSAQDGLWTIEMVQAVYASSMSGKPVTLPLQQRRHPLL